MAGTRASQKGRRLAPTTPRDWLPVAAAIAADANSRVAGGMRQAAQTAAERAHADELRSLPRQADAIAQASLRGDTDAVRRLRADRTNLIESAQTRLRQSQIDADAIGARLSDLGVHVGPGASAGSGAPAYYREADRQIVLDAATALPGVNPADVRWSDERWRREHLRAVGLVEHEVGHAAHTPRRVLGEWAAAGSDVGGFARRLEETRMEASAIRGGADRAALAGVAHELILREFDEPSGDPYTDALDAALILGRDEAHGGSLDSTDLDPFRDAYRSVHGDEWVRQLDELLGEWNATDDRDVPDGAGMAALRDRWRSALAGAAADPDPEPGAGESGEGAGESTDGAEKGTDGEGGDDQAGDQGGGGESADGDTDGGEGGGESPTGPEPSTEQGEGATGGGSIREMLEAAAGEAASQAAADARAAGEAEDTADDRLLDQVTHGYTPGDDRHRPTTSRPVTAADRRGAVELTRELRRLALPVVARDRVNAALPPGRLRGRGAVGRDAQRAARMVPTAEPFRATQKTVTRTPPPVIGIMLDVSGSMKHAAPAVAAAGWALAEAGRAIQAQTAVVTFGERGRLQEHDPRRVIETEASARWENFREGFNILDGRLHLSRPARGARLLIICTDGAYGGPGEDTAARSITRALERRGVVIVWAALGCEWKASPEARQKWRALHHAEPRWCDQTAGAVVEHPSPSITIPEVARSITDAIRTAMTQTTVTT